MLSATEIELWNRKLHTYVGLYLLFFIWLFAFTGLLLNHSQWRFAEFWPNRKQSRQEYQIQPPSGGNDLTQARALMSQLGMVGEVEWTTTRADQNRFEFRISLPGHIREVKADFTTGRATVERIDMNAWGVLHILHTFSGVRMADAQNQRDWIFTEVWAWGMDALAAGLIFMVLSSLYMWYRLRTKRLLGVLCLGTGTAICGLFVIGLKLVT
jgi:hypothetical protein